MDTITRQQRALDPAVRPTTAHHPAASPLRPLAPITGSASRGNDTQPARGTARRVPGFTVLAALQALDELHGEGPHAVSDVAEAARMPPDVTCRLLRLAEKDNLVVRPRMGTYVLSSTHAAAHSPSPLDNPDLFAPHPILDALQGATGTAALLFATTCIAGAPARRILLSHELGEDRTRVTMSPLPQQEVLMQAPLDTDPAGQVIAAFLHAGRPGRLDLRTIRDQSLAYGASPLPGLNLLAAPVWRGAEVAGSIALLVDDGTSQRDLRALTFELASNAVATSRQTTAAGSRGFRTVKAN